MGKLTIKQRFLSLLKMNNTPKEIALGVSLGVFIGVTPLYGFHTLMVILFALAVKRANKIAILLGTNISIPPTMPFLTWGGYSIGKKILDDHWPELNLAFFKNFTIKDIHLIYFPLFLGSIVLGAVAAGIFYFVTLHFVKRFKKIEPQKL